jgi:hypothetical protein
MPDPAQPRRNDVTARLPDPPRTPPGAGAGPGSPYLNPYLAGLGLGLVLLAAFVLVGRGLGGLDGGLLLSLRCLVVAALRRRVGRCAPFIRVNANRAQPFVRHLD